MGNQQIKKHIVIRLFILLLLLPSQALAESVEDVYRKGIAAYDKKDYGAAERYWERAAEQGFAAAQHRLGNLIIENRSIGGPNPSKALYWQKKAADQGIAQAQYQLGVVYYTGMLGVEIDNKKAFEYSKKATDQGVLDAQNVLASLYDHGLGVAKDHAKARCLYIDAAQKGHDRSADKLAMKYLLGKGVPKNPKEFQRWSDKAKDIRHGGDNTGQGASKPDMDIEAAFSKGKSAFLARKFDLAARYLPIAAKQGHAGAQSYLGRMYAAGWGWCKDYGIAASWHTKAAKQGHAESQFFLAMLYFRGAGLPKDLAKAASWLHKAADQGHLHAQNALGAMYAKGRRVPQDDKIAFEWFQKSAEGGLAFGQFRVGFMYEHGRGVAQDYAKALHWYRKSEAQKGFSLAQGAIAGMYLTGRGVKKSLDEAIRWYNKALEQGDIQSRLNVAWLLATTTNKQYRSPKKALDFMSMVVGRNNTPSYHSTLAAIHAAKKEFSDAVHEQEKAIALRKQAGEPMDIAEKRLQLYRSGHPLTCSDGVCDPWPRL